MDSHFKILSLIIHEGCNRKLLKALHEGVEYVFYQDLNAIPESLYDISDGPKVSISAIVGKNGEGKSSITEMMIRVMNNFAFLSGYRENQSFLRYITNLRASIKYIAGGKLCELKCYDDTVTLSIEGLEPVEFIRKASYNTPPKDKLFEVKPYLFYMLVSNYSLNSLNCRDFRGETDDLIDDWITPLFHKNDAYQTPINLNPMRTEGAIDINQERELSKQRLMSIFTEAADYQENKTANEYGVPTGEGYVYKTSTLSKLKDKTFSEYFTEHKYDKYSETKVSYDRKRHIAFWERYSTMLLNKRDFINTIYKHTIRHKKQTDFAVYLKKLSNNCRKNQEVHHVIQFFMSYPYMSFIEFQRIFIVIWLEKKWNESGLLKKHINLDSVFVNPRNLKINAQKYLLYKTVSVLEKYPIFFEGCIGKSVKPVNFFAYPEDDNGLEKRLRKAFDKLKEDICSDKTFMTLKIRQTINYINNFQHYRLWNNNRQKNALYSIPGKEYTHYVTFHDLLLIIREFTKEPVMDFLPPPIFEGDIILRSAEKTYPASHISSGERQMLNMTSAVVYHLRNLSTSLDNDRSFRYQNVHVCLDEIELCFHPAYQKQLVDYLLGQISAAHLPKDMNISISLLTHSPFVLSDIPQSNILYLKNGFSINERMTVNPFAANVNDILMQSFFMEKGFTGTFASKTINSLIDFLSSDDQSAERWNADEVEKCISIVGEPLLRVELTKLFWTWKDKNGMLNRDMQKRSLEEQAKALGGTIQWLEFLQKK